MTEWGGQGTSIARLVSKGTAPRGRLGQRVTAKRKRQSVPLK